VVKLGGFLGVVLAVAIVWAFTEWLYVDTFAGSVSEAVEVVITTIAAVIGWLAGSRLVRRLGNRSSSAAAS
jgi:hypothetical protein